MAATYTNKIDFNADGDYGDTGEDVTARTLARTVLTIRCGRDQARALAPIAPGEARFELDNQSRDYSPENGSSPLAGLVLPGRDVQIQGTVSAVTYTPFAGHTDDFEVLPGRNRRSIAVTCLDALGKLKDVQVSTELYFSLRSGEAIDLLLDAAGWPEDLRDLDPGVSLLPWWWVDDDDAFTALAQIVDSEGPPALIYVDGDGKIVFRDRHHRLLTATSTTSQATWSDTGSEPLFTELEYDHGWKEIVNTVGFEVPERAAAGALTAVWSTQGQTAASDGETVEITARASGPFTGAVTPVAGTDYTVVSGVVEVTLSRTSGASTTVRVKAVGGAAVITGLQVRAYAVETQTTILVKVEEPVSIGRYGRRSLPSLRSPVWASRYDAQAIAEIILGQRAERLPTVRVRFVGGNDTRLTQQLGRALSDRVTVVDAETGLSADFFIEEISHEISEAGLLHVTTFGLEKCPTAVGNVLTFNLAGHGFNDGLFGMVGRDDPATMFLFDAGSGHRFDEGVFAH